MNRQASDHLAVMESSCLAREQHQIEGGIVNNTRQPAHWSFWAIGAFALVWNLAGCINFFMQMDPEVLEHYRESEQAIVTGRPIWATAGFATGVFGGAIGSILLLLRRNFALHVFVISLLGVGITMVHTLGIGIAFSPGEITGIILAPIALSLFLVWYARYARQKSWIGH